MVEDFAGMGAGDFDAFIQRGGEDFIVVVVGLEGKDFVDVGLDFFFEGSVLFVPEVDFSVW